MEVAIYAPAQCIKAQPEVIQRLRRMFALRTVIVRDADPEAIRVLKQEGVAALWLAPGLWGAVHPPEDEAAAFLTLDVPRFDAHEAQWPMLCPARPGLGERLGREYARRVRDLGADGIFCTHLRYHHPADISGLWGCICRRWCAEAMRAVGLSPDVLWDALAKLRTALQQPAHWDRRDWTKIPAYGSEDQHPLVAWWDALIGADVFSRWFRWRRDSVAAVLRELTGTCRRELGKDVVLGSNAYEPIMAVLVGHDYRIFAGSSAVLSPLLGYHDIHFLQSSHGISRWIAAWAGVPSAVAAARLWTLVDLNREPDDRQAVTIFSLNRSAAAAAALRLPFWPTFRGRDYPADEVRGYLDAARAGGAQAVVFQGIASLLNDPAYAAWF